MESRRIVCTDQVPANQSHNHAHIVAVGLGDDSAHASQRLTLQEVLQKMDIGVRFYTIGDRNKKVAYVIDVYCCGKRYIKTEPDSYLENNLDELRWCSWK
jgi:rRNA maturation endonuclease Nob1